MLMITLPPTALLLPISHAMLAPRPAVPVTGMHARGARIFCCAPPEGCCEPDGKSFDDFERECFGDEDGCDAWYYGEDPDAEIEERTAEEDAALALRVRKSLEEGKQVTALRQERAAETENVQERVRRLLNKQK